MGTIFAILLSRIAFVLITIASVSTIAVIVITYNQEPSDPFGKYADIMPGQSQDALLERGFNCQFKLMPPYEELCSLMPQLGIFSEIQVLLGFYPYTIKQTIFKLPENLLTYGDLVLLWGKPQITIYGQTTNLRWHIPKVVAVLQTNGTHFSYWTSITYIAFQSA